MSAAGPPDLFLGFFSCLQRWTALNSQRTAEKTVLIKLFEALFIYFFKKWFVYLSFSNLTVCAYRKVNMFVLLLGRIRECHTELNIYSNDSLKIFLQLYTTKILLLINQEKGNLLLRNNIPSYCLQE